jgi:cytidine deaminase
MDTLELVEKARSAIQYRELTGDCVIGEVGAALLTADGNLYVGVSISAACGIGFCAEHSAIATMITAGETQVQKAVAVTSKGRVIPPCGRCREFFYQIDRGNLKTEIILDADRSVLLEALLPERWQEP